MKQIEAARTNLSVLVGTGGQFERELFVAFAQKCMSVAESPFASHLALVPPNGKL